MAVNTISSAWNTNRGENGTYTWNKKLQDINDIDESFSTARDLGYLRLNYSRLNALGALTNNDKLDIYKVQVQSNGKLSLSLRKIAEKEEKSPVDFSKYDDFLKEMGYKDPAAEAGKDVSEEEKKLLSYTAPGMRVEVYQRLPNGKDVLVADSAADKESKAGKAMTQMLTGEYKAAKGDYYVKITRADDADPKEKMAYAMQMKIGDKYKHDYVLTETVSADSKAKKTTTVPSTNSGGVLSSVNALQIQAMRNEGASNMLAVGYLNMADLLNKR